MAYRSPGAAVNTCARSLLSTCALAIGALSLLLSLSACSGVSVPASASSQTTSHPTSTLTISGTLPPASVGAAYNASLTASGGTAPYTFSLASGQLPEGIQLAASGIISGIPAATETSSFAIAASDSRGLSKQQSWQLTVAQTASLALSVTPATVSVPSGGSTQFSALVSNASNLAVTWSATAGTVSSTGVFSAPQVSANTTIFVSATSVEDSNKVATATVTVTTSVTPAKSFSNLQQSGGWGQYGQGAPNFVDCSPSPCDGIEFSMAQGIATPSMSGSATKFHLGGTAVYQDALFNNHLIGDFSSQGLPDAKHSLVPKYRNFTYDVYFYGANLELSQALEFDLNQFFNNLGFIWGHECRIAGGHEWDVWNNVSARWIPTGIACNPVDNQWNHLTIQVQRTASNQLLYHSITLNGVTSTLNQYYDPGPAVGWYGLTINYQMDGNSQQSPYSVYLDGLTYSYD